MKKRERNESFPTFREDSLESLSLSINVHGNGRTGLNGPQGQVRGLKRAGTPIIPWNSRIPRSLPPRLFP